MHLWDGSSKNSSIFNPALEIERKKKELAEQMERVRKQEEEEAKIHQRAIEDKIKRDKEEAERRKKEEEEMQARLKKLVEDYDYEGQKDLIEEDVKRYLLFVQALAETPNFVLDSKVENQIKEETMLIPMLDELKNWEWRALESDSITAVHSIMGLQYRVEILNPRKEWVKQRNSLANMGRVNSTPQPNDQWVVENGLFKSVVAGDVLHLSRKGIPIAAYGEDKEGNFWLIPDKKPPGLGYYGIVIKAKKMPLVAGSDKLVKVRLKDGNIGWLKEEILERLKKKEVEEIDLRKETEK